MTVLPIAYQLAAGFLFLLFFFFPPFGRISFYISIVTLVPKRI